MTLDPDGRRVVLTDERWAHIKRRHPEVTSHLGAVMRAVREPAHRRRDLGAGKESFLADWPGPGKWLRVVVHYDGDDGEVMTAYPESSP